jgi:pimeloyl-ACP methyl ester carboxylesterase
MQLPDLPEGRDGFDAWVIGIGASIFAVSLGGLIAWALGWAYPDWVQVGIAAVTMIVASIIAYRPTPPSAKD